MKHSFLDLQQSPVARGRGSSRGPLLNCIQTQGPSCVFRVGCRGTLPPSQRQVWGPLKEEMRPHAPLFSRHGMKARGHAPMPSGAGAEPGAACPSRTRPTQDRGARALVSVRAAFCDARAVQISCTRRTVWNSRLCPTHRGVPPTGGPAHGLLPRRSAVSAAQHQTVNALKTFSLLSSFCLCLCI